MIKNFCDIDISKSNIDDFVILGKEADLNNSIKDKLTVGDGAVIRSFTTIYSGSKIGNNFNTGHNVLVRENCEIGNNVSIGSNSVIEFKVIIEDNVRLHSKCFIPEYSILKKYCWLAPGVTLTNSKFPNNKFSKEKLKGVTIEMYAIIGANVTILPSILIGKRSLIGAGSVVTKSIPDYEVWAGNPAKKIGELNQYKDYE
tara:strand:- start:373 stop:972 length:600 start_codon:yes stop_codon:yes gene_type:complete